VSIPTNNTAVADIQEGRCVSKETSHNKQVFVHVDRYHCTWRTYNFRMFLRTVFSCLPNYTLPNSRRISPYSPPVGTTHIILIFIYSYYWKMVHSNQLETENINKLILFL
jgi:hypothetical protein